MAQIDVRSEHELERIAAQVHHVEQEILLEDVDQFSVVEVPHVFRIDEHVIDQKVEYFEAHFDQVPVGGLPGQEELVFECHEVVDLEVAQTKLLFEQNRDQVGETVEDERGHYHGRRPLRVLAVSVHIFEEELQ